MSGLLTRGGGENVPGIPGACAILRILQEAHSKTTLCSGHNYKSMNITKPRTFVKGYNNYYIYINFKVSDLEWPLECENVPFHSLGQYAHI